MQQCVQFDLRVSSCVISRCKQCQPVWISAKMNVSHIQPQIIHAQRIALNSPLPARAYGWAVSLQSNGDCFTCERRVFRLRHTTFECETSVRGPATAVECNAAGPTHLYVVHRVNHGALQLVCMSWRYRAATAHSTLLPLLQRLHTAHCSQHTYSQHTLFSHTC